MTSVQVVKMSVTVTDNSPFQDFPHPDDHTTRSIIHKKTLHSEISHVFTSQSLSATHTSKAKCAKMAKFAKAKVFAGMKRQKQKLFPAKRVRYGKKQKGQKRQKEQIVPSLGTILKAQNWTQSVTRLVKF